MTETHAHMRVKMPYVLILTKLANQNLLGVFLSGFGVRTSPSYQRWSATGQLSGIWLGLCRGCRAKRLYVD